MKRIVEVDEIGEIWYGYKWWKVGRLMVQKEDEYVKGEIE